jgi:hypothetical protein
MNRHAKGNGKLISPSVCSKWRDKLETLSYRMSKNYPLGSGLACSVAEESNTDTDSSDSVKNFKKKLSI